MSEILPVSAAAPLVRARGSVPRLRIALVTETFPPEVNGVAMTIGRMLDGLLRRGHEVQLVRPRQQPDEQPRENARLSEILVSSVPLPRYAGLRVGMFATGKLRGTWRAARPDIVHVVTEGPLGWSALTAARQLGLPATSDFHTNFHSYSAHYGVGFLKSAIGAYLRRFHRRSLCTFVPTRQLRDELMQEGYGALSVVARGVDTRLFHPQRRNAALRARWGVAPDDPAVVYVGRIAPEKNLALLLSSFAAVKRLRPGARLVLVGDGPSRARLERDYPGHVFAGMRSGEDLAAHYASGDLFLFPSTTETFGNVTIEAMASGLAVAAYDYAAAREHIVHGESGLLAAFDDRAAFERTALELAAEPGRTGMLRRNARRAAERIDWDSVIDLFAQELAAWGQAARADRGQVYTL
jgi:glycosyltransferase involved in cell wall biosynthesis